MKIYDGKRKKMRRFAAALIMAAICVLSGGCGEEGLGGKTLKEHGTDVIGLMDEMVKSEDYGNLMGASGEEVKAWRDKLAEGDYTTPEAVYAVSVPSLEGTLALLGEGDALNGFSDDLKRYINERSTSTQIGMLNSREGVSALAASSVYMAGRTFVTDELKEDTIYVYIFGNGYPVAVTFVSGEDGAVSATGTFLLNDDFVGASEEELQRGFREAGFLGTIKALAE